MALYPPTPTRPVIRIPVARIPVARFLFGGLLSSVLLGACAEYGATTDFERNGTSDESESYWLRIDVHPSSENDDLLPETRFLSHQTDAPIDIEMGQPVNLWGRVEGWDATPYLGMDVGVPGEEVPVQATVSAFVEGTVMSGASESDGETGEYEFHVPPAEDYVFSVVPSSPEDLPFYVVTGQSYTAGSYEVVDLDYGAPVYGRVTSGNANQAVRGMEVRAVDVASGVQGPATTTDSDGYYQLRVLPGEYRVVFSGDSGSYIPTLEERVTVEGEDGAELDIAFGSLEPVTVGGDLVDEDGLPVGDTTVRFTSKELTDTPGASLEVETSTDQNGWYSARLLEGVYTIEYIPDSEETLTPQQDIVELSYSAGIQDLGTLMLSPFVTLEGRVVDYVGHAQADVAITLTQTGFDAYTFSTVTDTDGTFAVDIPETEVTITARPPADTGLAPWRQTAQPGGYPEEISLSPGDPLTGTVQHDGAPVAFSLVEVRDTSGELYDSTLTDADGDFEIRVVYETEDLVSDTADSGIW